MSLRGKERYGRLDATQDSLWGSYSHQLKGMGRGQHKQGEAVIILRHKMKYSR
jgi:hypothetical protein